MAHVSQIKKALGIGSLVTESYSWRSRDSEHPAQIDLLIERADKMINLCEISNIIRPKHIAVVNNVTSVRSFCLSTYLISFNPLQI